MPTTTTIDSTFAAAALQDRTDNTGTPVLDVNGEELRLFAELLTGGVMSADAFEVTPGGSLSVDVGSGIAEEDVAVVPGTEAGQGNYLARLDVGTINVVLSAADLTNPRLDEIYLIIADDNYDSGGLTLPRIGYRRGDPAASPSAPGPDAGWDAYLLLATVMVGAGAGAIAGGDITDERNLAAVTLATTDHGDLTGLTGDDHPVYLLASGGRALTGNLSMGGNKLTSLGDPTSTTDAVNRQFADGRYLRQTGGSLTGALLADGGSVGAPGLSFLADGNSGFYVTGNNGRIDWSGNGVNGGHLLSTGIRLINGSVSTPSLAFVGATATGFYQAGGLFATEGGVFSGGFVDGQMWAPTGTAAKPGYAFNGDGDLGIYRVASNSMGFATAGVLQFQIGASGELLPKNPGTTTDSGKAGWRQLNFAAGANEILALTSSIEYKEDVRDVDRDTMIEKLREVRIRDWKSKASADDKRKRYQGIILEEQAKLKHWSGDEDISNAAVIPLVVAVQYLLEEVEALKV